MYREDGAPDRSVLVIGLRGRVIAKDRTTGASLWEHDLGERVTVEIAVLDDRVFASTGKDLVVIEYPSGRLLGRAPLKVQYSGRCTLLVDGHQVFIGCAGEVSCFDWHGQLLWHDPMKGKGVSSVAFGFPGNVRPADRSG